MLSMCMCRSSTVATAATAQTPASRHADVKKNEQIISQVKDPTLGTPLDSGNKGIFRRLVARWYHDKDNVETFDADD